MHLNIQQLVKEALAHQHAGRISIALSMFEEVLRFDPKNPQANFSLGIAAYQRGEIGIALSHLQMAARKSPRHPQVHQLLGLALMNAGDLAGARKALRTAVSLAPGQPDLHAQLGDLYRHQRKPDLARQCYQKALALDASNGYALIGSGQLAVSLGEVDDAIGWFEKAISLGKEMPAALQCLTMARTYKTRPPELDQVEELLGDDVSRAAPEQANLHWAAGKIHYDLGDTQRAVHHYRSARRLSYAPFDQELHEDRMAFMKEVFDEKFFSERADPGDATQRPVFIFGMPRSGTTLAEQIVSRHSRVASGAEISYFRHTQQNLGLKRAPSAALERRLKALEQRDYRQLARNYLAELSAIDRRLDRVTDKMPHNFEMLWLMSLLFPNATFIHCVRSPADTCVSLLSHALSPAHNYCQTQKSLGSYFRAYHDLMKHWEEVLPVRLHTLCYEELVDNQERESRALIAQAGLDWEETCLEFYNGDSPVNTFSNLQVRRPMYRSSIGRWKRHVDVLEDLFEALGPLGPHKTDTAAPVYGAAHYGPGSPADNDVSPAREAGSPCT